MTPENYGDIVESPEEVRAETHDPAFVDGAFEPGTVLGYFRRLEEILEGCPVDIYCASSLKHPWPYRLQNAEEVSQKGFWRSPERILDSAIGKKRWDNRAVLKRAVEKKATAVVAKDYLHDQQKTTESIREFARLYDETDHPRAYLPLQPPYDEHFAEVSEIVDDHDDLEHRYMLGGLARAENANRRVPELERLRYDIGDGAELHGLGWGDAGEVVKYIRENPEALASIDNSTAQKEAKKKVEHLDAIYKNTVAGAHEFAMLLQLALKLSEWCENPERVDGAQYRLGEVFGDD